MSSDPPPSEKLEAAGIGEEGFGEEPLVESVRERERGEAPHVGQLSERSPGCLIGLSRLGAVGGGAPEVPQQVQGWFPGKGKTSPGTRIGRDAPQLVLGVELH